MHFQGWVTAWPRNRFILQKRFVVTSQFFKSKYNPLLQMQRFFCSNRPTAGKAFLEVGEGGPPLKKPFVGGVTPSLAPTNDFQIYSIFFKFKRKGILIKDKICTINLSWSIELETILKAYFSAYSDYECGNHKVSLELYVMWVSYTLLFYTLNHYIRWNMVCHNRVMVKKDSLFSTSFSIYFHLNKKFKIKKL